MAMEEVRALVFDDDPDDRERIIKWLERLEVGIQVVGTAKTRLGALELCSEPRLRELEIRLVATDGNLTLGDASGADGRQIVAAIRETDLPIRVVAVTASPVDDGVDVHCTKAQIRDSEFSKKLSRMMKSWW